MTDLELAKLDRLGKAYAAEKINDHYKEVDVVLGGGSRSKFGEQKLRLALASIAWRSYAKGWKDCTESKDKTKGMM